MGAGMQLLTAVVEQSATDLAGPKGRHGAERTAVRHGRED
jgi:hypothetical protein